MDDTLLESLETAVAASPDDLALRLHLARLLMDAAMPDRAVVHLAQVLAREPGSARARELMVEAMSQPAEPAEPAVLPRPPEATEPGPSSDREQPAFDWEQAEVELDGLVPPMYLDEAAEAPSPGAFEVETSTLRLDDVAGLTEVKARLEASFLAPLRNPELRRLYRKSLRGGLLLYGPPGCGKTFIARAVAGEMGAAFLSVSLTDVLDMYVGNSEKNVHAIFQQARAASPCVVFLDELDAIGQKRSLTRNTGMRTTVNQLLLELDGVEQANDGVFVLGATNHPWDVDPALLRPGRFDRRLLVVPPDEEARAAIVRFHLADRPVEGIDVRDIARRTTGFSGADLALVCETAAEDALLSSVTSGVPRMIGMSDLRAAVQRIRPSTGAWFDTARNVVTYANASGDYDELARYMRKGRL